MFETWPVDDYDNDGRSNLREKNRDAIFSSSAFHRVVKITVGGEAELDDSLEI